MPSEEQIAAAYAWFNLQGRVLHSVPGGWNFQVHGIRGGWHYLRVRNVGVGNVWLTPGDVDRSVFFKSFGLPDHHRRLTSENYVAVWEAVVVRLFELYA